MAQPHLDTLLAGIRQSMGDTLTLANICQQLPRSQRQLLPLLRTMLRELCEQVHQALPMMPAEKGPRDA